MKVYLDNNVIIDIEQGKYEINDFLSLSDIDYYYSESHIGELLEARDNPKVSQKKRLDLISEICKQNCILTGALDLPEIIQMDVKGMYKIVDNPLRDMINNEIMDASDTFELLREIIGLDSREFNNEGPEEVLRIIDARMTTKIGIGLIPYLTVSEAYGGKVLYYNLLKIVDVANYWSDKKTSHSDIARLYDASHAYSAQICDVLVSNDRKMRYKIKAIYSFLGVKTIVLSTQEFFSRYR